MVLPGCPGGRVARRRVLSDGAVLDSVESGAVLISNARSRRRARADRVGYPLFGHTSVLGGGEVLAGLLTHERSDELARPEHPAAEPGELAVVLGGGGARGAYQVGVLRYLGQRFPDLRISILT